MVRIDIAFIFFLLGTCIAFGQEPWRNHPKEFQKAVPRDIPELVLLPSSLQTVNDSVRDNSLGPVSFYMSRREISNKEFCRFLNTDTIKGDSIVLSQVIRLGHKDCKIRLRKGIYVSEKGYGKCPVVMVSWYGAKYYCEWLTKYVNGRLSQRGLYRLPNFRLPGELEWVYAAVGKDLERMNATMCDTSGMKDTAAYGSETAPAKKARFSKEDVLGLNDPVFEWTEDNYYSNIHMLIDWGFINNVFEDEPAAVVRKHGHAYNKEQKGNCGREGRMKDGFYSDTGFRIVLTYLDRSTGWEF